MQCFIGKKNVITPNIHPCPLPKLILLSTCHGVWNTPLVRVSCPGSVSLCTPTGRQNQDFAGRTAQGTGKSLSLCSTAQRSLKTHVFLNNAKYSIIQTSTKKINFFPTKTMTVGQIRVFLLDYFCFGNLFRPYSCFLLCISITPPKFHFSVHAHQHLQNSYGFAEDLLCGS